MKYYLAYGSNLNKSQMARRCPDAVPVATTFIPNHQLVFRRGVLTIEFKPGASVPVAVWKISEQDERNLDGYEGFPHLYRKQEFPIILTGWKDGKKAVEEKVGEAMAYIMNPGRPIQAPSVPYMMTCMKGYDDFGLDMTPLFEAKVSVPSFSFSFV